MSKVPLHPITAKQIDAYINAPANALLLAGPKGLGKTQISADIAVRLLEIHTETLQDYPYFSQIDPEDSKSIGIDKIRKLDQFLSLKVPNDKSVNRIVIINEADKLTTESQNAMLKTLEEPPEGTMIILNASHQQALLPTISSRTQIVTVKKPNKEALLGFFIEQGYSSESVNQAYSISGGLPALMNSILTDKEHPLNQATETARKLLSQTKYERLRTLDELVKQPDLTKDVLYIIQQMARVSLARSNTATEAKWKGIYEASYNASAALDKSAQSKLVLTNMMLSF